MFVDRRFEFPRLQKFAAIFLVLETKIIFFWKKIPYVAIFYCLSWLVGGAVCHAINLEECVYLHEAWPQVRKLAADKKVHDMN